MWAHFLAFKFNLRQIWSRQPKELAPATKPIQCILKPGRCESFSAFLHRRAHQWNSLSFTPPPLFQMGCETRGGVKLKNPGNFPDGLRNKGEVKLKRGVKLNEFHWLPRAKGQTVRISAEKFDRGQRACVLFSWAFIRWFFCADFESQGEACIFS